MHEKTDFDLEDTQPTMLRVVTIVVLVVSVTGAHWSTPMGEEYLHIIHILLRKLYLVPVVLTAIWFNLRAAMLTAGVISLLYTPHIIWQWSGQRAENFNQISEIVTIWLTAAISGLFSDAEKGALKRLARAYEGVVTALVAALDVREHDTELHSLRVRAFTLRLARELQVETRFRRVYALGALLHDIGKIGIPDNILLKRGSLSDDEWDRIREHPELGRRIIAPVHFLNDAREIVYTHHEKYDGYGYPQGLVGVEIPMGARIFAVADVFDALTSVRSYKEAMTYDEARREIESCRETHFDPIVVDAFLNVPPSDWDAIRTSIAG